MFKRYWIVALAVGLTALSGQAQDSQEQTDRTANEQEGASNQLPVPLPVMIVEAEEATVARERAEQEAEDREKKDLLAQEGMNTATQWMAKYALAQTILIALGTVALVWTLLLTREAARAARDAVIVTESLGQKSTRAYLSVERCVLLWSSEYKKFTEVELLLKNSGQTPATRVRVVHHDDANVHRHARSVDWPEASKFYQEAVAGLSEQATTDTIRQSTENEMMDGWLDGRIIGICFGVTVFYEDIYGQVFRTTAHFMLECEAGSESDPRGRGDVELPRDSFFDVLYEQKQSHH